MRVTSDSRMLANWRKPVRSMNHGNCAEAASAAGIVAVRDSKDLDGLTLQYPASSWRAFLAAAKTGTLDALR
jgi:hypothetical protein